MENVYQPSNRDSQELDSLLLDEEDWNTGSDTSLVQLLEENARLRALIVQLSDLVLKNVAEHE